MRFVEVQFAEDAVVYDALSGDTHYLSPLNRAARTVFASTPGLTNEALHAALVAALAIDASILPMRDVVSTRQYLTSIGLIAPATLPPQQSA